MDPRAAGIAVGLLCGAVIGLERQWSGHATGPRSHFAGIRTLALLGALAAIAGVLWSSGFQILAAILLGGAAGVIVLAYRAVSRRDPDATTEVSALVALASGVLAGIGSLHLALSIAVITALLLVEKTRLHNMISAMPGVGVKAGIRFGLLAVVILPLMPEGPYGPLGGVRPRELWFLVLFFSGISFASFVISSILGAGRGYVVAGLLGGMISSTNVTLTYSRLSVTKAGAHLALALGVTAACTLMFLRVNLTMAVLAPEVARTLLPYMLPPTLAGAALIAWGLRRAPTEAGEAPSTKNPLEFQSALKMALLFQIVLFVLAAVRERWGETGTFASAAILGLTDVDALVVSMAKVGRDNGQAATAALATAIGSLSNTALKLGVALVFGAGRFRLFTAGALLVLGLTTAAMLFYFRLTTSSP